MPRSRGIKDGMEYILIHDDMSVEVRGWKIISIRKSPNQVRARN